VGLVCSGGKRRKIKLMFTKNLKPPKKTLVDLLSSKEIIKGKEVIHNLQEQEKRQQR
jgi:uncharacterized GH25 family protein